MRHYFFSILFFGVFGILGVIASGLTVLAQDDPFLEAEKVPFPFTDKSVTEIVEKSTLAQDVPVPPDTLASVLMENAEGYVPEVYSRTTPEPSSVLRPRYRPGSIPVKSSVKSSAEKSPTPAKNLQNAPANTASNAQNSQENFSQEDQSIRQVSANDAPAPPAEYFDPIPTTNASPLPIATMSATSQSPSQSQSPSLSPKKNTSRNQQLHPSFLKSLQDVTNQNQSKNQSASPYTVNNTCDDNCDDCDGLGCGDSGLFSRKHLNPYNVQRGLCDHCGFLRCANKTVGHYYYDGWLSVGSFMNTHWHNDRNNNLTGSDLYYNDRNGEAVMNQLYLSFGRRINPRGGRLDFGGRVDLLYGTDYFYTSSLGLETRRTEPLLNSATLNPLQAVSHWNSNSGLRRYKDVSLYGLSLPQAYAEMFVPFGYGITVKAGHFYSGMGLESAMSPNNFFYSHSYSFMYGEPTTFSGATATVKLGSGFSALAGITRGWNIWDKTTENVSGLAGLDWESFDKKTAISFLLHSGDERIERISDIESRSKYTRTNYSLTLRHQLTPRLVYSLEHTYGNENNGAAIDLSNGDLVKRGHAQWYSVAQYLQWEWSEQFAFGFRGEWFHDDGHSRIQQRIINGLADGYLTGKDYFEISLGANWKPTRFITIRPEVRYDWSNVVIHNQFQESGSQGIYGGKREMVSFAIDGIFRF